MDTMIAAPITITRIVPTYICADAPMFGDWKAQFETGRFPVAQADEVSWLNRRELLLTKGGENGVFLQVSEFGCVEIGFYMDAWGSDIHSGMFMVNQEAQYPSHAEAIQALVDLGLTPILNQAPAYMLR